MQRVQQNFTHARRMCAPTQTALTSQSNAQSESAHLKLAAAAKATATIDTRNNPKPEHALHTQPVFLHNDVRATNM